MTTHVAAVVLDSVVIEPFASKLLGWQVLVRYAIERIYTDMHCALAARSGCVCTCGAATMALTAYPAANVLAAAALRLFVWVYTGTARSSTTVK
jgi:hypothetical protein